SRRPRRHVAHVADLERGQDVFVVAVAFLLAVQRLEELVVVDHALVMLVDQREQLVGVQNVLRPCLSRGSCISHIPPPECVPRGTVVMSTSWPESRAL